MELIDSNDTYFSTNEPLIIKKVKKERLDKLEPSKKEQNDIYDVIINFIKRKKRKVYGGSAIHFLLEQKGEPIYDETSKTDIDFYSPDPITDIKELCDELYEKKFSEVKASEAMHEETYKLFVNYEDYCDITYVPLNIYNKIKFIDIDGIKITHPWFLMIDQFRILTDPLISYEKNLKKIFERHIKLYKHYPLPKIDKDLIIPNNNGKIQNILNDIFTNLLMDIPTLNFTGLYTYNYYSTITNSSIPLIQLPYYECYSTDFQNDGNRIMEYMKKYKDIQMEEHYPFFQFFGNSVVFYIVQDKKTYPILYLYSNNKRCIPYKNTEAILFNNGGFEKIDKYINIGSFDFNILYSLILLLKHRIDDEEDKNDIIYKYINGIIKCRKNYLAETNKTVYDDTIFQSFVVECMGITMDPFREQHIKRSEKYKKGKLIVWKYDPENKKDENKYIFKNSSGNKILKEEHLKLNY